jgi:Fuc2NAc and GlcNAc transferase
MPLPFATILACVAFAVTLAATVAIERRSSQIGLIQAPNARSAHTKPTPTGGGGAIAVVGTIGLLLTAVDGDPKFAAAGALAMAFATLGFIDDRSDLSPALRFPLQLLLTGSLVALAHPLPPLVIGPIEFSSIALSALLVMTGLWWINLFNFMDGIDGIAASQAVLVLAGSAIVTLVNGQTPLLAVMVLIAATSGFLVRNWPPARIFMGDVGSNFLAFAILTVALIGGGDNDVSYPTWLILGSLFVSDATVTLIRRVLNGEKPWHAHNRHAYQHLARRFGHVKVTLLYCAVTIFWSIPIAIIAGHFPAIAWELLVLAYLPVTASMVLVGAGLHLD